jgi:RNA polymerase sigma-70 factor, ECF subfamily
LTEDLALVRRMLAGDEDAFDEFFDAHFAPLYRFALARMGHEKDGAEDVVQATLARAVTKLATFRGEAQLFTWLCTFCRHEISAYYARARRAPPTTTLVEDSPEVRAALDSLARSVTGPESLVHREEIARLVHVALDLLPARYGDALEWKYVEGLSVVEIAARLTLSPKAAESLLTRAREAFRDAFATLTAAGRPA